ncbi:FkbM family methyltransferase [Thermodesulfobacteriota bacterium]
MRRVSGLVAHIKKGTLFDRLRGEWRERTQKRRRSWWEAQKAKREYFDTRIERGIRIRLHFDSELAQAIYCSVYERTERHFLDSYLRPGDVFVDVGANIGLFTLIAANLVGGSGRVFAFEPALMSYNRLQQNVELNNLDNVQCFQSALSNEIGEFPFFTSKDGFDAWNSFAQPTAGKSFAREFIQSITWDQFAHLNHLVGKVTMMKIDVEGWETRVLEGGNEIFSRKDAPVLQVEFTDAAALSARSSCEKLYKDLKKLGYKIFTYDILNKMLVQQTLQESYEYTNLYAFKEQQLMSERNKKIKFELLEDA